MSKLPIIIEVDFERLDEQGAEAKITVVLKKQTGKSLHSRDIHGCMEAATLTLLETMEEMLEKGEAERIETEPRIMVGNETAPKKRPDSGHH